MNILFSICAVIGGTVLVCQFIMSMIGLGGHGDGGFDSPEHLDFDHGGHAPHDANQHDSSWFFGMVTFRTVVAALTFFGLTGLAGEAGELPTAQTLGLAILAGAAAMFGVHWIMKTLHGLKADGTVRINRAIGLAGTVYLRVPAHKSGVGKIQINVQNRTMEYEAMTSHEELPIGARVVVVNVIGPDTVEVALEPSTTPTASTTHA